MDEVTCQRCQTTNEFYIEESGPHLKAMCNHCDRYIKFVTKDEPKLYIGKYKGIPIKDIEDMQYLKWALSTLKLTANMKKDIQSRISTFENLAK